VSTCKNCGGRVEYSGTGRRPSYCSKRCKWAAERKRGRFAAFRRSVSSVSPPERPHIHGTAKVSEPPAFGTSKLSEREKESQLGRPLAHGMSWEDYRVHTGRGDGQGGMQ
jgi:hypothetical protein